jgi:tetratricopeptide (TPR) repeat protein
MPIEGPLRELGIHDVFQLLDLSRKTGVLAVTSALRDNQGQVYFDRGAVTFAALRSNPRPLGELLIRAGKVTHGDIARAMGIQEREVRARALGEILVDIGAVTRRELERHVRFQVEEIVFGLLSWAEGYFSFEERTVDDAPAEAIIRISTESLLMEAARRIDEWSRIERVVPHAGVVPALAPVTGDQPALLDLLPNEWEVLAEIDGVRDLRAIATHLARSEFEVAKITYGLVMTGVVAVHVRELDHDNNGAVQPRAHLERALSALRDGDIDRAVSAAREAVSLDPTLADARLALARGLLRLGRHGEAMRELKRATGLDALNADVHRELGFAAAHCGELSEAVSAWERYLRVMPAARDGARIRGALEAAARLRELLAEHVHVR